MIKMIEYMITFFKGGVKEILEIKNNSNKKISIPPKKKLIIIGIISDFIKNNSDFILGDFKNLINKKIEHLSFQRLTPTDMESYINGEFNKWLKTVIFSRKNEVTKKNKDIIYKYYLSKNELIFDLSLSLRRMGLLNYRWE